MRMVSHGWSVQLVSLKKQALPVLSPTRLRRLLPVGLEQLEHILIAHVVLH